MHKAIKERLFMVFENKKFSVIAANCAKGM